MKYIHLYKQGYCESDSFKGTPNTIELTDEQYEQLQKGQLMFQDGNLVVNPDYVEMEVEQNA